MPSKMVTRFRSMTRPTIAGVTETAAEVAESLSAIYDVYVQEGEARLDWVLFQNLVNRRLIDKGKSLVDVDARLETGRTSEKEARAERDQIAADLRQDLTSARLLLDQSFGRDSGHFRWRDLAHLVPAELIPVARETATSLRSSPKLALKAERTRKRYLDASGLADVLEEGAQLLEEQIETLVAPRRQRETYGVGEKGQELAEAHSVRLRTQDLLFGIYRAAGKDHLAARLRPKRRMPRMEATENGGEGGGEPMLLPDAIADQEGGFVEGMVADGQA